MAGVVVHGDVHVGITEQLPILEARVDAQETGAGVQVAAAERKGVHGLVGASAHGGGGEEGGGGGGVGRECVSHSIEVGLICAIGRVGAAFAADLPWAGIGRWREQDEDQDGDEYPAAAVRGRRGN